MALLLCTIGGLASSCRELVFDEQDETITADSTQSGTVTTDSTVYITVAEALALPTGSSAVVRGYIVGHINGTRLSQVEFGIPVTKANTNIVLADKRNETDIHLLLPVRLVAGSTYRTFFNLLDRPELLHRRVIISAKQISTYFGTNGITDISGIKLLASEEDVEPGGTPNLPPTPGISDEPTFIEEGR